MSAVENPPAFPVADQRAFDGTGITEGHPGMTLRDWFAGQALAGFLADGSQRLIAAAIEEDAPLGMLQDVAAKTSLVNEQLAIGMYQLADAMLAERSSSVARATEALNDETNEMVALSKGRLA